MPDPRTAEERLRAAFIDAWYELLGEVDDAIVRGGWRIDEVGTEEVFDKHRRDIEDAVLALAAEPVPVPEVDAAWEALTEDLYATGTGAMLGKVHRHRPIIEAAIRATTDMDLAYQAGLEDGQSPSIDVERLHPDDGYAYEGCNGFACRTLRQEAKP